MIIKRSINFSLQPQKIEVKRIRMRVTYGGNRLDFQTGITIKESSWDQSKQRIKTFGSEDSQTQALNDHLSTMVSRMIEIFQYFEQIGRMPSAQEIRDTFSAASDTGSNESNETKQDQSFLSVSKIENKNEVTSETEGNDFWKVYDEFVKINGKLNDWTKSTFQKFAALRNKLWGFNEKLKFSDFDENGIADFVDYLSKVKKLKNSTINKQQAFLRWFLRWAYERHYHTNNTFEYYKPKLKCATKPIIFLTQEELGKVENFVAPEGREGLNVVRDVFLFSCYTGLRYSDVEKLTWDDIHGRYIEIVTKKTNDRLIIDFNKKSMAILGKYSELHLPNKSVMPVISNQHMNEHLKEICKMVGIDDPVKLTYFEGQKRTDVVKPKYELMSTHAGRRTFICTALAKGIPPSVVMKWTGHSDYKAMKPYIDIADEVRTNYMKKFDENSDENEDGKKDGGKESK